MPEATLTTTEFDVQKFQDIMQRECRIWQKRLRLQDWNVQVRIVRLNAMPDKDAIGVIYPVLERKDAVLCLLSPGDAALLSDGFQNREEYNYDLTLVHELLHLHMAPFTEKNTEYQTVQEEIAVNAISRCLLNAYAKSKPIAAPPVDKGADSGHYL